MKRVLSILFACCSVLQAYSQTPTSNYWSETMEYPSSPPSEDVTGCSYTFQKGILLLKLVKVEGYKLTFEAKKEDGTAMTRNAKFYIKESTNNTPATILCSEVTPATTKDWTKDGVTSIQMEITASHTGTKYYVAQINALDASNNVGDRYYSNIVAVHENRAPEIENGSPQSTVTGTSVTLSWLGKDDDNNLDYYKIMYRKKNETPQWTHTANLSSTSHTLTDLSPNTEYEWQVIAVDKCGAKSTESSSPWTFTTAVTTYTVTFFIDGGKLSSSLLTQSVAKGGTIKYPGNPTKQGYDFGGWYYGYNTPWNFVYGTVNSDMTLWAKWLPAAAASLRSDYHNRTVLLDWNDLETKTITFVSSGLNWEVSAKSPGDWLIFAVDGSQHSTFNKYGEDNKPTVHTIYYRARTRNATAYAQNGEIVISDWKYNRLSPVKVKLVQQTQPQPAPPSVTINFAQHEAYYFQADGTPKNPKYSSFILSANVSWKISSDRCCNNSFVEIMENGGASWLKMSNGPYLDLSGTKTICLKVDKNTTGSDRTETLTVKDISSGTQATIRIEQSATSVDNEVIPDGEDALWYYPNPAGKTLTVRAPNPHGEKVTVSLNSLSGQSVYRAETYETEHRIDVQSLNRGVYILYVTVGNERYTAKVIRK